MKAREVFKGVENNNGVSVKTTDKVSNFSSTIFKALHNSFTKRDTCAKLELRLLREFYGVLPGFQKLFKAKGVEIDFLIFL